MTNYVDAINEANICAVSFCVDSDLLSQWRGYTDQGVGYFIGFHANALMDIARNNTCQIAKCIYDQELQLKILDELIDGVLISATKYWDNHTSTEDTQVAVGKEFNKALIECGAFFKDTAFKEEREWRIVTSLKKYNDAGFCFREGKSMLTPYFRLKIRNGESWANKIAGVTVGPCPHPEQAKRAVEGFLAKKIVGSPVPKVTVSKIPYRSW